MCARRSKVPLPIPTWTCPHCGFVHKPADIRRVDNDHLRCQKCGEVFDSKAALGHQRHPD